MMAGPCLAFENDLDQAADQFVAVNDPPKHDVSRKLNDLIVLDDKILSILPGFQDFHLVCSEWIMCCLYCFLAEQISQKIIACLVEVEHSRRVTIFIDLNEPSRQWVHLL